jgi:hypothetical protein
MKQGVRFRTGIILLIISQLLGWGCLAFLGSVAIKSGKTVLFLGGTSLYAVSWGLLGLGVILARAQSIPSIHNLFKKLLISLTLRSSGLKKDGSHDS